MIATLGLINHLTRPWQENPDKAPLHRGYLQKSHQSAKERKHEDFSFFSGHSSYGRCVCFKPGQHLFLFTLIWLICAFCPGCLENRSSRLIDSLMESPKLISPEEVLSGFRAGETRSRIIVMLRNPSGDKKTINFKNIKQRKKLQQDVKMVQDRVINNLDPKDIRIINRFTYIFGFSAEVTLKCLQQLIDDEDVLTVEKERMLHQH